jgi:prostatic aicd phosphatase
MNVQSIHNATFARDLPPTFLAQARDLANWHEYNVFSSAQLNGIGNSEWFLPFAPLRKF